MATSILCPQWPSHPALPWELPSHSCYLWIWIIKAVGKPLHQEDGLAPTRDVGVARELGQVDSEVTFATWDHCSAQSRVCWRRATQWQKMAVSHPQSWGWSLMGQQRNISSLLPERSPGFLLEKWFQEKKKKKKVVYSVCLLFSPELHLAQKDRRCSMQPMCVWVHFLVLGEIYVQRQRSHFPSDPGRGCFRVGGIRQQHQFGNAPKGRKLHESEGCNRLSFHKHPEQEDHRGLHCDYSTLSPRLTEDLEVGDVHRICQLLSRADAGYRTYCRRTSLWRLQILLIGADKNSWARPKPYSE